MGVMDKFLNYMKLNDEEDEGFYRCHYHIGLVQGLFYSCQA